MAIGTGREYGCGSHPDTRAGRRERKEQARNVSRQESRKARQLKAQYQG